MKPGQGPQWHPLVFHSLDVAAVGYMALREYGGLRRHLSELLGLTQDQVVAVVCYLLALHDIGKFAQKFQAKAPAFFPLGFEKDPALLSSLYDHAAGGLRLFDADPTIFWCPKGVRSGDWRGLFSASTGHHGSPPRSNLREVLVTLHPDFGKAGVAAARLFAEELGRLLCPPDSLQMAGQDRLRSASFAVAGFAVLADWTGSNQHWFPYREPDAFDDLGSYWDYARAQAALAVEQAGVLPAAVCGHLGYDALIGTGNTPSPMQSWARSVDLPAGPALIMIEDETGSGKTEAALMLAHRLMVSGKADGLYMALPTMATANAMFDRLSAAHRSLFAEGAVPSLALVHGARDLHQGFRSAVLQGGRREPPYPDASGMDDEASEPASAACAAWVADDRRRAFLADVGAGTVDQALLSVLPSCHQSLRLLGLMRRVLILDEVHAYDAYMQREIEALLEFQAGLGGSAVLLSATLPLTVRQRLADAFSKGLREDIAPADGPMNYPLATVRAPGLAQSFPVAGRADRARVLPVRFLRSVDDALDALESAARAGKAALYLRNTVDDVLEVHVRLSAGGFQPDLFHARFALVDRLAIEARIIATFGKESIRKQRAGKILAASQVVEQSLDLDFDVLITDLAPIDLLIQRAGRLWRHERPNRAGQPELLVVAPPPVADADEDWFSAVFPRAAYVYRDHARLWLTAKVLEDAGVIDSPGGLRALIEAVYGPEAEERLPAGLMQSYFAAEGRSGAERGVSATNVLALRKGYVRDGGAWDRDIRTPTRLADDPQVTVRLARVRDGRIVPYAMDAAPDELWRAWRLSEVTVSARRVGGEAVSPAHVEADTAAKADWTRFDQEKVLVVLEEDENGSLTTAADSSPMLAYHPDRGLIWP